jgi:hypothetical protein
MSSNGLDRNDPMSVVELTKQWTWDQVGHWARKVDGRRHRAQRGVVR